jgi:hypothetical protein
MYTDHLVLWFLQTITWHIGIYIYVCDSYFWYSVPGEESDVCSEKLKRYFNDDPEDGNISDRNM